MSEMGQLLQRTPKILGGSRRRKKKNSPVVAHRATLLYQQQVANETQNFYQSLEAAIKSSNGRGLIQVISWVLLPTEAHLILRRTASINDAKAFLAGICTKAVARASATADTARIWRAKPKVTAIRGDVFRRNINSLHRLPVEAGLVQHPEQWRWTTAGKRRARL